MNRDAELKITGVNGQWEVKPQLIEEGGKHMRELESSWKSRG